MTTERNPRLGEPWRVRSTKSSYTATGILRWKPGADDEREWVIVGSDGRSHIGGADLPNGWVLVAPLPLLPLSTAGGSQ
ncbi:hypothetical protein SEA_NYCEIRAE_48 [Gordonia phage Nyceirae]|uniref:Uncharacterized protein n=1 Tax=Gordonia phage Nyceirae TaxID=1887651 RepID=A0A1C9EI02_9CAUD|nr:hypothetical protein BIZ68_gp48 [Gordonia phage Nyceirae]AON97411.1 hypothetical protein SEA_NYCEIRAE_48 [Gordonia phage Nyceirae]